MEELNQRFLPESPEDFELNKAHYLSKLEDLKIWADIPILNYTLLHELKDNSLVRFRGMVQDMQDPEIYLERYEVAGENGLTRIQEGKFRDCLVLNPNESVNYESDKNVHGERRTLFVVAVPGLNSWAKMYEESCNRESIKQSIPKPDINKNETQRKRLATDSCTDVEMSDSSKRHCPTNGGNGSVCKQSQLAADYLLNSPIPERPGKACMIKVYRDFDTYTLNSVLDVVGFLSINPALAGNSFDEDELLNYFDNINEIHAQNPPPALIPRLHAVAVHRLPHLNPLLDARLMIHDDKDKARDINAVAVYKDLKMLLTLCLFNDDLAADYLIANLISTVYNRSDSESIGKLTLNLCNIPQEAAHDYTRKLYEILELLIPASHYFALSLDNMNSASFVPKKDYETNKLVSGILQLAPHTHLVLDETQMGQGKLEANGVSGIQSLAYLIKHQQIRCNFQYYEINYNTDIPVIVLSEGRSMLPSDFILPLRFDDDAKSHITETLKAAHHYLQPHRLDQFRRYLTEAKTRDFAINAEDCEMIQTDFVEMRKTHAANSDDLHALLLLSRLLSISRGRKMLEKEFWILAKEMESVRKQRIQALPKPSRNAYN